MAVHREPPTCMFCGEPIEAIIDQQENTPSILRRIGDNFIGWDYDGHSKICNSLKTQFSKEDMLDFIRFCGMQYNPTVSLDKQLMWRQDYKGQITRKTSKQLLDDFLAEREISAQKEKEEEAEWGRNIKKFYK